MARSRLDGIVRRLVRPVTARPASRSAEPPATRSAEPPATRSGEPPASSSGDPSVGYSPEPDGRPDPGEVVWAWVAYEDDPREGKDRPVLVIGRHGTSLLALQLTSKDHDRDAADEARYGRFWMDIGSGGWDREQRPSEVRLDRLLRLEEQDVRREGAALDRQMFEAVLRETRRYHDDL